MSGPRPGRSGVRLWVYLAALLCVSALCVAPFAIVTVASATSRSTTAHRMQEAIRSVVALEAASDALNSELLPSVLLGLLKTDVLRPTEAPHSALTLGSLRRIATGTKSQVRDATDDALRPLAASQPELADYTATQLKSLRDRIDAPSVTTAALQDVYLAYLRLADRLNEAQKVAAEAALERGVHLTNVRTVQDITEIAAANLAASRELPAHFMDAAIAGHQAALATVGLTWGQASQALDSLSEPDLLRRWREVRQTGTLDALDTALAQPLTSAQAAEGAVNRLLALDQTRASALSGLLYQALLVADRSAVEVRHQANVQLFRALGLVALLVLTALAAVVSVSQAIARPLRRLSAQAREISEGHLVDVDVIGRPAGPAGAARPGTTTGSSA